MGDEKTIPLPPADPAWIEKFDPLKINESRSIGELLAGGDYNRYAQSSDVRVTEADYPPVEPDQIVRIPVVLYYEYPKGLETGKVLSDMERLNVVPAGVHQGLCFAEANPDKYPVICLGEIVNVKGVDRLLVLGYTCGRTALLSKADTRWGYPCGFLGFVTEDQRDWLDSLPEKEPSMVEIMGWTPFRPSPEQSPPSP